MVRPAGLTGAMRNLLAPLLLAAACGGPVEPLPQPPIEILIHGQSNGVSPANSAAWMTSSSGRVSVTDYYCEWETGVKTCGGGQVLVQPTATKTIRANQAWIALGDSLVARTGRDVIFYNLAVGGSTTAQLRADSIALRTLVSSHPGICAVFWIQGESEQNIPPQTTVANIKALIDISREQRPTLPWAVALNGPARVAQLTLIGEGVVQRGPDIDSLRAIPGYFEASGAEFEGSAGHRAHATAWLTSALGICA